MAKPTPQTNQELASNLVQEIAKNCKEVPHKFLHKDGFPKAIDGPNIWENHCLLIDFTVLNSSTLDALDELAKMRSALSNWGCFQVINHGIESSFLEEVVEVSKQFFALPVDEKLKYSDENEKVLGYGTGKFSAGDQAVDWNDGLYLILHPPESRSIRFYPHHPHTFKETIDEYSEKLASIFKAIYKAMARSLDLNEECFLTHQSNKTTIKGRIIHYPRCPHPETVLGVKPHSDGTYMTILLQDNEVDGLQVQKDQQWYKVPVIPSALFINLGDLGEVITNGIYKSVVHRVVTNCESSRVSVAAFWYPDDGDEIGPVSELIGGDCPQKYRKFDMKEFKQVFFETYAQGLTPLDALKL